MPRTGRAALGLDAPRSAPACPARPTLPPACPAPACPGLPCPAPACPGLPCPNSPRPRPVQARPASPELAPPQARPEVTCRYLPALGRYWRVTLYFASPCVRAKVTLFVRRRDVAGRAQGTGGSRDYQYSTGAEQRRRAQAARVRA